MALVGQAPKVFSYVSRHGVPVNAMIVTALMGGCTISGFPRVSFMSSRTNETVGSEAVRDGEDPGNIFKVLPRESAHATLTLDDPAAAGCSAARADLVAVVLPGDTMAMTLSNADLNVCSGAASAVVGPLEPGA